MQVDTVKRETKKQLPIESDFHWPAAALAGSVSLLIRLVDLSAQVQIESDRKRERESESDRST